MPNKKDTNFTHKREVRLNQESFYEMGKEQGNHRQRQDKSLEQAVYIEQLQQQLAEYGQVITEQTKILETQKKELAEQNQIINEQDQVVGEQNQIVEEQKQVIENEKRKAEEANELYLRARADIENSRRRARNEKEQVLKYANVPLLESLLPVLDNFERALQAADHVDEQAQTLTEGVEMVYRHFLQVLAESGLSKIEAVGKPFDPHSHNAVMEVQDEGVESGIVVEELQPGYHFLDRVIRPTMVKVSK